MKPVEFGDDGIEVDAAVVAEGLGITPALLQEQMRAGKITTVSERGVDADRGRHRLTFFTKHRRLRLVVDDHGAILQRSTLDFGDASLPRSAHRPR
jgi:hypothetical protein